MSAPLIRCVVEEVEQAPLMGSVSMTPIYQLLSPLRGQPLEVGWVGEGGGGRGSEACERSRMRG